MNGVTFGMEKTFLSGVKMTNHLSHHALSVKKSQLELIIGHTTYISPMR